MSYHPLRLDLIPVRTSRGRRRSELLSRTFPSNHPLSHLLESGFACNQVPSHYLFRSLSTFVIPRRILFVLEVEHACPSPRRGMPRRVVSMRVEKVVTCTTSHQSQPSASSSEQVASLCPPRVRYYLARSEGILVVLPSSSPSPLYLSVGNYHASIMRPGR